MNATSSMDLNSDSISQNDKPNINSNHTVQFNLCGVIFMHTTQMRQFELAVRLSTPPNFLKKAPQNTSPSSL